MGKVSEKDFAEMSGRLRARATRLMRQLDAGAGYREQIEREIEQRLGRAQSRCPRDRRANHKTLPYASVRNADRTTWTRRFCKGCGKAMEPRA
jgi:hypothetical protein